MGKAKRTKAVEQHWIDAHCHLCTEPLSDVYIEEIEAASELNIRTFITTALTSKEVEWHLNHPHPAAKLVAGIHPYYEKSFPLDIENLQELAKAGQLWGIGEVGFDKRKNNHNFQTTILRQQLDIAVEYKLPVIFHIVGKYNELYQILNHEYPEVKGYIHGFSGSPEMVKMFSRLDVAFSLGNKILRQKDAAQVLEAIIEHGFFLFETDAPFQRDHTQAQESLYLSSLMSIIESVSELTSFSPDELLEGQWDTYKAINSVS